MERLTYYHTEILKACTELECKNKCNTCKRLEEAIKKLKAYEDAEEQGLLLRLPCNAGDKIWAITTYSLDALAHEVAMKHPQEKKIQSITVTRDDVLYHVKNRTYSVCNFGKTVFLTKEDAEQALTEEQAKGSL